MTDGGLMNDILTTAVRNLLGTEQLLN